MDVTPIHPDTHGLRWMYGHPNKAWDQKKLTSRECTPKCDKKNKYLCVRNREKEDAYCCSLVLMREQVNNII